jgi:hypothetical protein
MIRFSNKILLLGKKFVFKKAKKIFLFPDEKLEDLKKFVENDTLTI